MDMLSENSLTIIPLDDPSQKVRYFIFTQCTHIFLQTCEKLIETAYSGNEYLKKSGIID